MKNVTFIINDVDLNNKKKKKPTVELYLHALLVLYNARSLVTHALIVRTF